MSDIKFYLSEATLVSLPQLLREQSPNLWRVFLAHRESWFHEGDHGWPKTATQPHSSLPVAVSMWHILASVISISYLWWLKWLWLLFPVSVGKELESGLEGGCSLRSLMRVQPKFRPGLRSSADLTRAGGPTSKVADCHAVSGCCPLAGGFHPSLYGPCYRVFKTWSCSHCTASKGPQGAG